MTDTAAARRPPHPVIYLILYLPYGAVGGYITVTLAWLLLSHAGASVEAVAALAGMALLPNTWKVAWSPLVDTTLTAKAWFMIGLLVSAALMAGIAFLPLKVSLLPTFGWLVLGASGAGTLTAIAIDRIMAFEVPDKLKGQAGGWSQAGNLGGTGLGGGAGLWLAQHAGHPWISGAVLAVISIACAWPLLRITEPGRLADGRSYIATLVETGRDVLSLVRTRIGVLACFLMLLPIGSGGLQQLWAAIAKDWGAGADEVALVGGLLSGLVSIRVVSSEAISPTGSTRRPPTPSSGSLFRPSLWEWRSGLARRWVFWWEPASTTPSSGFLFGSLFGSHSGSDRQGRGGHQVQPDLFALQCSHPGRHPG